MMEDSLVSLMAKRSDVPEKEVKDIISIITEKDKSELSGIIEPTKAWMGVIGEAPEVARGQLAQMTPLMVGSGGGDSVDWKSIAEKSAMLKAIMSGVEKPQEGDGISKKFFEEMEKIRKESKGVSDKYDKIREDLEKKKYEDMKETMKEEIEKRDKQLEELNKFLQDIQKNQGGSVFDKMDTEIKQHKKVLEMMGYEVGKHGLSTTEAKKMLEEKGFDVRTKNISQEDAKKLIEEKTKEAINDGYQSGLKDSGTQIQVAQSITSVINTFIKNIIGPSVSTAMNKEIGKLGEEITK